jgi:hypothetical protein
VEGDDVVRESEEQRPARLVAEFARRLAVYLIVLAACGSTLLFIFLGRGRLIASAIATAALPVALFMLVRLYVWLLNRRLRGRSLFLPWLPSILGLMSRGDMRRE